MNEVAYFPQIESIKKAKENIKKIISETPLQKNLRLSNEFDSNIFLKREDLQIVRSYKLRGAFNKIQSLHSQSKVNNGVVCASAGNHAQGVAYSCSILKIKGVIFMPITTPKQKLEQVQMFGGDYAEIKLVGDTFDDSKNAAIAYSQETNAAFIHPFDDPLIIEGQATVGLEILQQLENKIDYVFIPIGGGGLAAGISSVFKQLSPETKLIGVEPKGAPSMKTSIKNDCNTELDKIDKFVDGAAVQKVGDLTFDICKNNLHDCITVDEGKVCDIILQMYNRDAIVLEPAGALSIAALEKYKEEIKGKNIVCILSGSNNDITRMEEIKERALLYNGLKHYFIINFPQRAGALRELVNEVLDSSNDISYFQYIKKNNKETGPAVVGIELDKKEDFDSLIFRLKNHNFEYQYLNTDNKLFSLMIG